MPFRSYAAALALSLSPLLACTDAVEPSVPVSPEAYAAVLASAYCDFGVRCESAADADRFSAFCHPAALEQKLGHLLERQPHMVYDQEAAGRCLATIEEATATCTEPFCEPVLVGTLVLGASCDEAPQCGPGLTCTSREAGARCSGVCVAAGAEGERCRAGSDCAEGLHCEGDRCVADRAEGGRCERSSECRAGLRCDPVGGQCYAPGEAEGRACDPRGPDTCPVPTDCVDGVCTRYAPGRVAGPGEPCESGQCAADHFCDAGLCAPGPTLTEPCDDARRCVEGRCVEGSCRLLPVRAACERDAECATDRCRGTCQLPGAIGARCEVDRDCANGLQCDEDTCAVRGPCS